MRPLATIERALSPGYGVCYRCERPWRHGHIGVEPHVTDYDEHRGCFPLCEGCWSKLTPSARLPYYVRLWDNWMSFPEIRRSPDYSIAEFDQILSAVMAGK